MKNKMNKVFEYVQKNYTWMIAITTALSVIISNIFRFIEYITGTIYFSFYGLDMNLYRYNDQGFMYNLCLSFIFIIAAVCLLYCFYEVINDLKNQKKINKNDLSIIVASNLYIVLASSKEIDFISVSVILIALICTEIIAAFIIFGKLKNKKEKSKPLRDRMLNCFKILPFLLTMLIVLSGIRTQISLIYRKNYRIIDDKKVIVYSNNDYYITLDCEVNNNQLIIYKGTQEKISNDKVYSEYQKFILVNVK